MNAAPEYPVERLPLVSPQAAATALRVMLPRLYAPFRNSLFIPDAVDADNLAQVVTRLARAQGLCDAARASIAATAGYALQLARVYPGGETHIPATWRAELAADRLRYLLFRGDGGAPSHADIALYLHTVIETRGGALSRADALAFTCAVDLVFEFRETRNAQVHACLNGNYADAQRELARVRAALQPPPPEKPPRVKKKKPFYLARTSTRKH